MNPSPTSVYRYYDEAGMLIYVGVTSRGMQRNLEHVARAEWWRYVASQDVQHYPDRWTALSVERELIERHCPPFNKQHNGRHQEAMKRYLRFRESSEALADPLELMRRLGRRLPLAVEHQEVGRVVFVSHMDHYRLARQVIPNPVATKQPKVSATIGIASGSVIDFEMAGPVLRLTAQVKRTTGRISLAAATLKVHSQKPGPLFAVKGVLCEATYLSVDEVGEAA